MYVVGRTRASAHTVQGKLLPVCGRPTLNHARTTVVLERLARETAERMRPVCAHLSEPELLLLASSMAVIELKFLGRASTTICEKRRPSVALLMEQLRLSEPDQA